VGHSSSKKASNKYYRHSRIDERTFCQLVRYFALDYTASDAALRTGLTRKTVTSIFIKIRRRIALECTRQSPFGTRNFKANGTGGRNGHGHSPSVNNIVFGLFKRDGNIYTEIVLECEKPVLRAVILGRLAPEAATRSADWRGYAALVDVGWAKYIHIECGQNGSAHDAAQRDDVESFWRFSQRRLQKFNGICHRTFYLHLKECEWRFNNRSKEWHEELLNLLQEHPL